MFLTEALRGWVGSRALAGALAAFLFLVHGFAAARASGYGEAPVLRGVALTIGNGDYAALPSLANPPQDADAIEELLSDLGFDAVRRTDRDADDLRKDLDRFVEDAGDADVAVLYYAGHGIEAGGENFLVPVDADLASLDAAGERLVPLSDILNRLRQTVPVTILLLDACRDNPFPPTATLRVRPDAPAEPLSAGGLGQTRGVRALDAAAPKTGSLGMVIGFAAEPGMPALDGDIGGHSPYAAALLRHIDAMAGEEFGTVMRMVAEEVYLKTGGRQRPWTNESLRRLLYLGDRPDPVEGAEGEILTERRQLLVHIAALPDPQRAQAETLARSGQVPMSVVYAMMRAAGLDPTDDPQKIEARLKAELERFAELRRTRNAMENPDPEIERLTRLADEAELEGALHAADDFREQAKQRVASLRDTRLDQLEALRQRFFEDAEVFARSAETKKLLFRFEDAARDYGGAREIVAEVDREKALRYGLEEIDAYLTHSELQGSSGSLDRAEALTREALGSSSGIPPAIEAELSHRLALILLLRSSRAGDMSAFDEALGLLAWALSVGEDLAPAQRGRIRLDHGRAVGQIALAKGDFSSLTGAEADFEQAASLARQAGDEALEAEARFRQVQSLYFRWAAAPDPALLQDVIGHMDSMMTLLPDDETADALAARYIANATYIALDVAMRQNTPDALSIAGDINGAALDIFPDDRFPLIAAELKSMAGRIALEWAERFGDGSGLLQAEVVQRAALETFRQAEAAAPAREAEWRLGMTLSAIGRREPGNERLREAIDIFERLGKIATASANAGLRNQVDFEAARTRSALGRKTADPDRLREAAETFERLKQAVAPGTPDGTLRLDMELGTTLAALARLSGDTAELRRGTQLLAESVARNEALGARTANIGPFLELYQNYADAAAALALVTKDPAELETAIAAHGELHSMFGEIGNVQGSALAANGLAYLLVTALRLDFDPARLARAEELAAEARAGFAAMPQLAGYLENTTCEIRTERARHDRDLAIAKEALAECRHALELLTAAQQTDAVETAKTSVERALELLENLGD